MNDSLIPKWLVATTMDLTLIVSSLSVVVVLVCLGLTSAMDEWKDYKDERKLKGIK